MKVVTRFESNDGVLWERRSDAVHRDRFLRSKTLFEHKKSLRKIRGFLFWAWKKEFVGRRLPAGVEWDKSQKGYDAQVLYYWVAPYVITRKEAIEKATKKLINLRAHTHARWYFDDEIDEDGEMVDIVDDQLVKAMNNNDYRNYNPFDGKDTK
jgi:hypothetical protein